MRILGIETSCDETAVCLIEADGEFGPEFRFRILGNALSSQASLHAQYGGVYPNLAKREHGRNLTPLLAEVLRQEDASNPATRDATVDQAHEPRGDALRSVAVRRRLAAILEREPELHEQLSAFLERNNKPDIDAIAVTAGPGLEPALWVGVNFAKALSIAWSVPIVAVDHLEGHIIMSMMNIANIGSYSSVLQNTAIEGRLADVEFPVLSLLISGGNTQLVLSSEPLRYEIIGRTRDDAAGEAFDKVARMLGLPYPGGPEISRLAAEARQSPRGDASWTLPRPMLRENNYDFSFSGLKTAVLRMVEAHAPLSEEATRQIAREFEDAVADVLVGKTLRAVEAYGASTVVTGGGVSANALIRRRLADALSRAGAEFLVCPPEFSTDNAVMIALAGYFRAIKNEFADPATLKVDGDLRLGA